MKAYNQITAQEMLGVIKGVFDTSSTQEKRREYIVQVSVWGFQLHVHIYKDNPKDWRITGFDPTGDGWDEMLMAVHAINEELDMRYY